MPEVVQLPRARPLNKRGGQKNEGDRRSPGVAFAEATCLRRARAELTSFRGRRRQSATTADPSRRGPFPRDGARSCVTGAGFRVSRSTPAVRAAERRSKRGMAVRPSPASVATIPAHSARRTPPGSRPPWQDAHPRKREPEPPIEDACSAIVERRALGVGPPHRDLSRARGWKSHRNRPDL